MRCRELDIFKNLEIFKEFFGNFLEIVREFFGNSLEILLEFFEISLGILWECHVFNDLSRN